MNPRMTKEDVRYGINAHHSLVVYSTVCKNVLTLLSPQKDSGVCTVCKRNVAKEPAGGTKWSREKCKVIKTVGNLSSEK